MKLLEAAFQSSWDKITVEFVRVYELVRSTHAPHSVLKGRLAAVMFAVLDLSNCQTFARRTTDLEIISKKQLRNTIEGGVNNIIIYMKSVEKFFLSQIEAPSRRIEARGGHEERRNYLIRA